MNLILYSIIIVVFVLGIGIGFSLSISAEENLIPSWIKQTAEFWVEGKIGDYEFLGALQYLVKEGILIIPNDEITNPSTEIESKSETSSTFPDPQKDPRYYLKRYYTESTYKEWYDRNYPNVSIEEKVGYDKKIIPDDAYVNELFEFSILPPSEWNVTEAPPTVDPTMAGVVSFEAPKFIGERCDYQTSFILHYIGFDETYAGSPDGFLDTYEFVIYFDESSQTKLTDKEYVEFNEGKMMKYKFNDVGLFPEVILDDGTVCEEEHITLKNEYVVILFDDGERYDVIYSTEPQYYDETYLLFDQSIDTFKRGKSFEKVSTIINYNE